MGLRLILDVNEHYHHRRHLYPPAVNSSWVTQDGFGYASFAEFYTWYGLLETPAAQVCAGLSKFEGLAQDVGFGD
jgi:hypothetical protein